jgi:hypothetical protein
VPLGVERIRHLQTLGKLAPTFGLNFILSPTAQTRAHSIIFLSPRALSLALQSVDKIVRDSVLLSHVFKSCCCVARRIPLAARLSPSSLTPSSRPPHLTPDTCTARFQSSSCPSPLYPQTLLALPSRSSSSVVRWQLLPLPD